MLLRGKYDVLINVTWDCFDQSNFYVSRINIIEWNNIQLLHLNEINMRFYGAEYNNIERGECRVQYCCSLLH